MRGREDEGGRTREGPFHILLFGADSFLHAGGADRGRLPFIPRKSFLRPLCARALSRLYMSDADCYVCPPTYDL